MLARFWHMPVRQVEWPFLILMFKAFLVERLGVIVCFVVSFCTCLGGCWSIQFFLYRCGWVVGSVECNSVHVMEWGGVMVVVRALRLGSAKRGSGLCIGDMEFEWEMYMTQWQGYTRSCSLLEWTLFGAKRTYVIEPFFLGILSGMLWWSEGGTGQALVVVGPGVWSIHLFNLARLHFAMFFLVHVWIRIGRIGSACSFAGNDSWRLLGASCYLKDIFCLEWELRGLDCSFFFLFSYVATT